MDLINSIKYLTQELYKDNNKLFYLNMLFLYSIEDRVYKDKGLHTYFKSVLKNPSINLYYLYSTTLSNPKNVIFKSKLDKLKSDYLKIVEITDENLSSTIVPIHRIFYRLFVKGGAALKIFVDYLVKMDVIKTEEIPDIANNPTDIDTNLIINPYFADSNNLYEYLKVLIKDVCLYLIVEYNELYNDIDENFYTKLVRNESIVRDIKNFYPYRQGIELRLPSISNIQDVSFGNGNYSIKQDGCNVRLTYLNNSFEKISVFRLLLAMDIIDYKMNIQKVGDSEVGYPIEDVVLESSAELIDITFYNIDNIKINKIWNWAINTIEYGSNNTLFIGLHEYILDLIGMIDNVEKNPMLALKSEKRIQRRDFLYKLYCNYRLIQQIVENNSEINKEHITLYCKNLIDKQYLTYELTQPEIDSIVPYIIGENPNNFEIILINFIKKYILENDSMLYKLYMNSSGELKTSKYTSIINNIDPDSLLVINNYINTIFNKLDINTKAKIFSNLVSIYNENQINDKTTLLLYISIVKSCKDKPEELGIRISNNYKQYIRQAMNYYPSLFLSDHIKTLYRKGSNQQIISQLLNENIAKMVIYVITNITSDIDLDILILNKYAPFKIICSSRFNFYLFLELIIINLNRYLASIGSVQYNIIYELIHDNIITIYFRIPCNEKIGRNNFDGLSDLLFAKIIFSDIKHKDKMVKIFNINNKSLFFNNT